MLFNSGSYLQFFILVFIVNYLLGRTTTPRHLFLLVASCYFYACWNNMYLILILISTLIDYIVSRSMDGASDSHAKKLLLVSIFLNLTLLGVFKYYNFFIDSAYDFFNKIGIPFQYTSLKVLLPVGISFYTFQTMSYTIDVYRKKMKAEKSFIRFALFVAFFPQLVAGPIVRADTFLPQLRKKYRITKKQFMIGMGLIWFGLLKKVIFADFFARYSDSFFSNIASSHNFLDILLGVYSFAFQIYFDFSGYTDAAIGCALLLGYIIPINFLYPYSARSIRDFWQRWHISLSTWVRDYLYIPLGGGRKKKVRNTMITFGLSGLWHGAAWHFAIWGLYHGVLAVFENFFKKKIDIKFPVIIRQLIVFHIVCIGWILFRVSSAGDIKWVFINNSPLNEIYYGQILASILIIVFYVLEIISERVTLKNWVFKQKYLAQISIHALIFLIIVVLGNFGNPFMYFQF